MDRRLRATRRVAGAVVLGLAIGALCGLATFGLVVLPLSFFASVTEPSAGRGRPLYTTGSRIAVWLASAVAVTAAAGTVRLRLRSIRSAAARPDA